MTIVVDFDVGSVRERECVRFRFMADVVRVFLGDDITSL